MRAYSPEQVSLEKIVLHSKSRFLELVFCDGFKTSITCEFLRVYSPSAEVRGHGRGQEVLQFGKKNVSITNIEQIGNYAIKITFSDGHDTGLYSWRYLRDIGENQNELWKKYTERLKENGRKRENEKE